MLVAMAGFTANDALTKSVAEHLGTLQIVFVRGLLATVLIAALAYSQGALRRPAAALHRAVALRVVGEAAGTFGFLVALPHMELAAISSVLQALPLAVTMGAALFLGEPVGWRRWMAIAVGFVGVLVIVRPGFAGFNAYSLLALLVVVFAATRDLATRGIPAETPTLLVSTVTSLMLTLCAGVLIVFFGGWVPMSGAETTQLATAAVMLLIGYQFIIGSLRVGEISFIATFRYSALLWAILLGYLMFGNLPDTAMIVGAAIVVSSGIYTLYRERRVGRGKPAAESTSPVMAPDGV